MKIGIVTMFGNNYGALLQSYALQQTLFSLGHDVYIINRGYGDFPKSPSLKQRFFKWLDADGFDDFRKKHLRMTAPVTSTQMLIEFNKLFDIVIAGSDQIWNGDCINTMKYYYYLDWVSPKVKKYSYAVSFGKDSFNRNEKEIQEVSTILKSYNAISVREDSGVGICNNILGVNAVQLLDPTFLLKKEEYAKLISCNTNSPQDYVCHFFLDSTIQKENLVNLIAKNLHLTIIDNYNKDYNIKRARWSNAYKRPTIPQWLKNIRDAKYVITDSFHGMVFSIIFKKQFVVINNKKRGTARFESLLKKINLNNRLIDIESNYDEVIRIIKERIDYESVDSVLSSEISNSMRFLKSL